MEEKTEKEINTLIDTLDNQEIVKQVKEVQVTNPLEELGRDLFSFFKDKLELIQEDAEFKEEMKEILRDKLKTDKNVTFSQVANLFINHSQQISLASEQLISLLKAPQGGTSNPLLDSIKKNDIEKIDDTKYDSETQRKLDIIYRTIESKFLNEDKKQ